MNNSSYMGVKLRSNKMFFLVLFVSFLSMQWSTSTPHIHLEEEHGHDDVYHQHEVKAHAHEQAFSYDGSHSDDADKLVELDHDCNRSITAKYDNQYVALNLVSNQFNVYYQAVYNRLFISNHSRRRYIDYSTINLRAPPLFS